MSNRLLNIIDNDINNTFLELAPEFKKNQESDETIKLVHQFFNEDLRNYIRTLNTLDQLIQNKQTSSEEIKLKLYQASDEIISKGNQLEINIQSKTITKKIKYNFRKTTSRFVYQSRIMKIAYEKPRGYPGDYKLLEYIYDNHPISEGIGYFFDKYFLDNKLAHAVRNRKDLMVTILFKIITETNNWKLNIFNIASGSCRDIKEFMVNFNDKKLLIFNCLDHDEKAIDFSKNTVKENSNIKLNFIKEDVIKFAKNLSNIYSEKQDIIYSIGLADYIPDRLLKRIIYLFFQQLTPQGKLILAHKDKHAFSSLPPDWFCDWNFVPRDEHNLIDLINGSGIKNFSLKIERERSGVIFFLILEKT